MNDIDPIRRIFERKEGRVEMLGGGEVEGSGGSVVWHWSSLVVVGCLDDICTPLYPSLRMRHIVTFFECIRVSNRLLCRWDNVPLTRTTRADLKAVTCNICQCTRTTQGWRSPPATAASSIVIIYYKTAKRPRYLYTFHTCLA